MLGQPVAHSLSPLLHTAAYAQLDLDWMYTAIDCGVADLPRVLAERADWAGFSCTMPLKRAVLDVVDEVRPVAAAVGAANTLLPREDGGWLADNTDVAGIVTSLAERVVVPNSATILGAGGTAQAAIAALAIVGLRECTVLVRDVRRTDALRATAEALDVDVTVGVLGIEARGLRADLVISTLPSGAADPLAAYGWARGQHVLDVVYDPWPTPLAAAVTAAGAGVLSGALMLLHQAAAQVELMTGLQAPVDAMRAALHLAVPSADL